MFRRTYYDRDPYRSNYTRRSYDDSYIRPYSSYGNRYRDSTFNPLYYGYSRRPDYSYPWERDHEWRTRREENRNESREVTRDERDEELREPEKDEEVNKKFHVNKVDLNIKSNTEDHHTDKYMCTKRKKDPDLVIRRGQSFKMTITFDRPYNNDQNEILFTFKTGKSPRPSNKTQAQIIMNENTSSRGEDKKEWFAKLLNKKEKSIEVEITPPCTCVIGEWRFTIQTESKIKEDGDKLILTYKHNEDVIILLNPWCPDDLVYMGIEELLNEYILNESGAIWSGNHRQMGVKPWNFGQFRDGILNTCLHLIRKAYSNTVDPAMSDPIKLARAISKMVNAPDDNGVLIGNWSGDYSGGTPPMKWVGSVAILEEYAKNQGTPVKFGQCWVFSGLTTTVCRAIGLPARSVTNFASAHDTDGSTCIDKAFVRKGEDLEKVDIAGSSDSIWNFHVWNETWMSRPDLGKGYDGWQVIDATPQELSSGVYQCGPAPVAAIKKGEIGRPFDAPFIFAEVNADIVHWEILPNDSWVIIKTDSNDVGKNISTKKPDGKPYNGEASVWRGYGEKYRLDVTSEYKYPEGSLEERLAVQNADNEAKGGRDVFAKGATMDISVEIDEKDGVLVGNDFEVELKLKNIKKKKALRTVKHLQVVVDSVKYTGDGRRNVIKKSFDDIRLDFGEEKTVKFTVKTDEYLDKMYELFGMEIMAYAHIKETDNCYVKTDDYRLRRPDITIEVASKVKVGNPFKVKLSFKNPLPKPLTKCSYLIEGNGIENKANSASDVPAKSEWSIMEELVAETEGEIQINCSFDCEELRDIIGMVSVTAE